MGRRAVAMPTGLQVRGSVRPDEAWRRLDAYLTGSLLAATGLRGRRKGSRLWLAPAPVARQLLRPVLRGEMLESDTGRALVVGRIRPVLWQVAPVLFGPVLLVGALVGRAAGSVLVAAGLVTVMLLGWVLLDRRDYQDEARQVEDLLRSALAAEPRRG